ncbi:lipopolysaccharide 1,3-galactosyltransferase [Gilliamella sp. HK2]|uniref:glycosyltransferase n=1 Tax=unclassified Gilliamella TaxID=2685620 RepID=UPI00080EB2B7|nr:glycosyltransferase [Gilliamella apicola]OCG28528.1 lipopolysaccharide 1,3-galactosyltransferase [Gilliamella apicola]OCG29711.1 lipopolysaccharide 1,3-galactosyltransferase [Gilliamella apicola]
MYFNSDNIIKRKIRFTVSDNIKPLNIAYGIDKNFFLGCAISITSILLTNTNLGVSFHIFTNYTSDDIENKLEELANKYNTNITIYLVDDHNLSNLPTTKNWTIATYFRFIVADYFYKKTDKILYLDADIICKGSLQELVTLQFDNNIAYVVTEKDPIWWKKCAIRLNEHKLSSGYFNAGFLLINLEKWKEFNINVKALNLLSDSDLSKNFTHLDQDVLNLLLREKVKYLDRKYNQQVSINYELKYKTKLKSYTSITDKTILIHYIGPSKPWHKWAKEYDCSKYFLEAKSSSPWKLTPLLPPTTSKQIRYCAKHRLHQKKIFSGLICYLLYFLKKIQ